jgi:uncharacterized membrane protein
MKRDTTVWGVLAGIGAGAAAMYFLDPDRGARRRALVTNKVSSAAHHLPDAVRVTREDLSNRAHGIWHETTNIFKREKNVPDDVVVARVRSKLGRVVSHPHAIKVRSDDGHVKLSGIILADEVPGLLKCVRGVPGVKSVENDLEAHSSPEGIPSLQGGTRRATRWEFLQENWSPAARFVAGTAGASALAFGLVKRDAVGLGLGTLGAALLTRSATNTDLKRFLGFGEDRRAVTVEKSINVDAPVDVAFGLWSNFENFPLFMENVLEVKVTDEGRKSHWKVAGPGGAPVEWDAVVTKYVPNDTIAWKSVESSGLENAGIVTFRSNDDGSTQINVHLTYNPPAGGIGHTAAVLFGADPKSAMHTDLMRMKSMLETGQMPTNAAQSERRTGGEDKTSIVH